MSEERVIIIGASGTIGTALLEIIGKQYKTVVPLFASRPISGGYYFDACKHSLSQVAGVLSKNDTILFLAAYTNQEWVKANPEKSRELNVSATSRIAEEVANAGAKMLFMSSEAVFSNECKAGWLEDSKVSPITEYGRLKAEAEDIFLRLPRSSVLRTGWNVGWNRNYHCVVSDTYFKLLNPDAKMAFDNYLTITDVRDTAQAINAVIADEGEGIYHLVNQPAISRCELANIIIDTSIRRNAMHYVTVEYKSLHFIELKAANSYLKTGKKSLKYTQSFRSPQDVIRDKVQLLDKLNSEK